MYFGRFDGGLTSLSNIAINDLWVQILGFRVQGYDQIWDREINQWKTQKDSQDVYNLRSFDCRIWGSGKPLKWKEEGICLPRIFCLESVV